VLLDGQDPLPNEVMGFRTAPLAGTVPVSFMMVGDLGVNNPPQFAVRDQFMQDVFDVALLNGDVAYESGTHSEFQSNYFNVYEESLRQIPFIAAVGNHEFFTQNGQPYLDVFALPENGIPGRLEREFSFDYGDVHIVGIDSNIVTQDTADWLEADLQANTLPWTIVYFHHHVFGEGSAHPINESITVNLRTLLSPVMEEYGVDLAYNGNNHIYGRSVPIKNAQQFAPYGEATTVEDGGVIYVTSGAGGRSLYTPYFDDFYTAPNGVSISDFIYVTAKVSGCQLALEAIDTTGAVVDSYVIDKCGN
jgi:hypothetical protein